MLSSLIQLPAALTSRRASWCGTCFRHTMIFMGGEPPGEWGGSPREPEANAPGAGKSAGTLVDPDVDFNRRAARKPARIQRLTRRTRRASLPDRAARVL